MGGTVEGRILHMTAAVIPVMTIAVKPRGSARLNSDRGGAIIVACTEGVTRGEPTTSSVMKNRAMLMSATRLLRSFSKIVSGAVGCAPGHRLTTRSSRARL